MSIRVRLTLWYAAALGTLLLGFALGVYFFVQRGLTRQLDARLDEQVKLVAAALDEDAEELEELAERDTVPLFEVRAGDRLVFRTPGWERTGLAAPPTSSDGHAGHVIVAPDGTPYRLRSADRTTHARTYRAIVAGSTHGLRRTLATLATILLVGLPVGLAVALCGGWFLAGRLLAPLHAMAATARRITAERLAERLPVVDPGDELGQLALVVNELLGRLDESFQRLRRFTADASHELRTPLTAIRSVGEVALQNGGPDAKPYASAEAPAHRYREAIGSMLEEVGRLTHLLDDLLTLTRADEQRVALAQEPTALAELVTQAVDVVRVLAEEKNQRLEVAVDENLTVTADRRTLRQAVLNLLDNAIKYTPANGAIRIVACRDCEGAARIEVSDDGLGIAPEHQQRVFERFYRVDPSRGEQRGAGLGLSIAQWSVAASGGRIELESEVGRGSTFRIILPARAEGTSGLT